MVLFFSIAFFCLQDKSIFQLSIVIVFNMTWANRLVDLEKAVCGLLTEISANFYNLEFLIRN